MQQVLVKGHQVLAQTVCLLLRPVTQNRHTYGADHNANDAQLISFRYLDLTAYVSDSNSYCDWCYRLSHLHLWHVAIVMQTVMQRALDVHCCAMMLPG